MIETIKYAPHEFSKLIPEPTADEKAALAADIKKNGLIEPIILFEEKVLDGRSRQEGCAKSGEEPRYKKFDGYREDALAFVVSKNIKRRHLTTQQRADLALELEPIFATEAAQRQKAWKKVEPEGDG